jgi:hypothetical protein
MSTKFCENLFVKIKLLLGLIVKSSSDNSREYADNLCDLINKASNAGYSHMLLMGDFNLPDIN